MRILRVLALLILVHSTAHSTQWTEGTALPESQAVVKTIAQIKEHAAKAANAPLNKKTARNRDKHIPYASQQLRPSLDLKQIRHPFMNIFQLFPSFTAATYQDSGVVPPDAMGVVGPRQFILAANGRVRSFDKYTGEADHILDLSTDQFFSPVSEGFTTDTRIRYDRFSNRWYIVITAAGMTPIRVLLAVSDGGDITHDTKWSFFYFEPRPSDWSDYPTLGIDKHALYIGMNFLKNKNYVTSDGYVIPKIPLLAGTLKVFAFYNMVDPDPKKLEGPISPQGVDNYDLDAEEGYFIGIDGFPGRLMLRRIKDPGVKPMISESISIKVPNSQFPLSAPQKGSLTSDKFFLQGFDKRLGNTHVRDKRLYTAHSIGVDNKGSMEAATPSRNGCLWYEISLKNPDQPTVNQQGVLFQPSRDNDLKERYFWMPGVMTNGLHTLVISCCTAGSEIYADAAYALRFSNDPQGSLRPPQIYTESNVVYNLGSPPFKELRWGEYTTASVDPSDNMTLWSISEFALAPLSWGLQAVRIAAPPPAQIVKVTPSEIEVDQQGIHVTILGERVDGSAFYDPDDTFPNHLKVDIEGVKVNGAEWISPTQIQIVISTESASVGPKDIVITNPDGQTSVAKGALHVVPRP